MTLDQLWLREGYTNYLPPKFVPGTSFEYSESTVELADCVSFKLEALNHVRLTELAPDQAFASQ